MRRLLIATAVLAAAGLSGAASAQQGPRVGTSGGGYQAVGAPMGRPAMNGTAPGMGQGGRWGPSIGGHWAGGAQAPGGWRAYHRPTRGWTLPHYWVAPDFYVADFASYGLSQPGFGYSWMRYYDDAVLVDQRGKVWDSVSGVNWDGGYDQAYAQPGYTPGYDQPGYAGVPIQGGYYPPQPQNNGVGGAVAGAVVGGVAGNVIAGRGNRLGGTLIGAGVGALAGQAIDKSQHRTPAPGYGAPYPAPGYAPQGYAQSAVVYGQPHEIVQPYVGTSTSSASYYSSGYVGGATVVQGPSVITETTTTTYIEDDRVTWHKPIRRAAVKRVYHPVRRQCSCTCGC